MAGRILIVDDLVTNRIILKVKLNAACHEVLQAANGQEAIDAYAQTRPAAATLDLVMPHYDGLHALRGIKELNPEARIVVVSALEQRSVLKEAFRLGASDFILKPFDKRALAATLDQLVAGPAILSQGS